MPWTFHLTMILVIQLVSTGSTWAADPIRIAGGPAGGTYRTIYTDQLEHALHGRTVGSLTTAGTAENVRLVSFGDADFGFAQADVYADMLLGDPDQFSRVQILGSMGSECVFVAAAKNGPVRRLADIGRKIDGRAPRIAVGPASSGTYGTWRYLSHLNPTLAGAQTTSGHGAAAIVQLGDGELDAAIWVTDPENDDHDMRRAVEANRNLHLVPAAGSGVGSTLPNGIRVYRPEKIRLGPWPFGRRIKTLCTQALLIARPDLDAVLTEEASTITVFSPEELISGKGGL